MRYASNSKNHKQSITHNRPGVSRHAAYKVAKMAWQYVLTPKKHVTRVDQNMFKCPKVYTRSVKLICAIWLA